MKRLSSEQFRRDFGKFPLPCLSNSNYQDFEFEVMTSKKDKLKGFFKTLNDIKNSGNKNSI